jgi:threonine dehydrogenase-like Zn-dependent dehydrogenase
MEAGEVLVETVVSALSTGTDLGNYEGGSIYVPGAPDYPRWVGYSNVGRVIAAGAEVRGLAVGDVVFSTRPHLSAFIAPESSILASVPGDVSPDAGSLLYLTNLGLRALQQARFQPGEDVAVIGMGVIGLCTVAVAKAMGAATVVAVANAQPRAEAALRMGATRVRMSDQPTGPESADVVVLTANTWESYQGAMEMARLCGRVSILGFPGRGQPAPAFNPMAPEWIYRKQLALVGAGLSQPPELRRNLAYLLELMSQGRLDVGRAISHRFPAARMVEAYDLARQHDKQFTAAVFDWSAHHGRH